MNMEKHINELAAILKAENAVFVRYLEKLGEQQRCLIENDLAGIKASVEQINVLAQEAMNLETGRRSIIDRLSRQLGVEPSDVSLSQLLEKFKGPRFDELQRLKDMILDVHGKVTAQKHRNELLIEQSMSVIRQTMNYINEICNPQVTYGNPVLAQRGEKSRNALISRTG